MFDKEKQRSTISQGVSNNGNCMFDWIGKTKSLVLYANLMEVCLNYYAWKHGYEMQPHWIIKIPASFGLSLKKQRKSNGVTITGRPKLLGCLKMRKKGLVFKSGGLRRLSLTPSSDYELVDQ